MPPAPMTAHDVLIGDLLDLPERVHKGDFVLNLSEGVTRPRETLDSYVVTPQLADCFDNALGFIRSALEARSSKACYLHGSFGAGKSHFMAVLHLLLQHHPEARKREELAPVCARHGWVEGKKFLLVPYHLIGARNLESAVLGGYVEYVRRVRPEAPLPGVYVAEDIFDNAKRHRQSLGDDKFFAQLNQGEADADWGALEQGWDAATFEAALKAPPGHESRSRLVGDLVQHLFPAYRGVATAKEEAFVPLDQGLSVLSRHAKTLGYDGLILFLDELILWLASHAADLQFLHREGQKLAKLVESQSPDRPAPVVSFVARQRDLRDLVGDSVTGAEHVSFSDALKHWEGRFHTITLEDRNLPEIAEKRVLRARDPACRDRLDRSFQQVLTKFRQEVRDILLTQDADEEMFRKTYPFSPALVQALVAVSSALQRERTALKIMLQLLVEKRGTLRLGDLVPVGDLWDAVAHGEEAFSDVLRAGFENARKLYHHKLRPLLEEEHQVQPEQDEPRAAHDRQLAARLAAFAADDRLVKTLLLAALVPEVPALKNLTPARLAALNWGSVKAPVPGREGQAVLNKLRKWASRVGEIRISDESANPVVSVQVVGVDTDGIIEKARHFDNTGNQQRKVRDLVMEALGLTDPDAQSPGYAFTWRGTPRQCDLVFANVRDVTDETLRSRDDWKVAIDWPFDPEGHDRSEDVDRLQRFQQKGEQTHTLVWLPVFFSRGKRQDLGKLVILDHLLRGETLDQYARHLSLQDRVTARSILESQRNALNSGVKLALEAAYGIREPASGMLEGAHDEAETRFWSLCPGFTPQPPVGANLADALEHLVGQALAWQFPGHPAFELGKGKEVRTSDLRKVLEVVQEAARDASGRVLVEKGLRPLVRAIANPLNLGSMGETHFVLGTEWRTHFDRQAAAAGVTAPKVQQLREWIAQKMQGMPDEVENLVILAYAAQADRTFWLYGGPEEVTLERLRAEVELRSQQLPAAAEWQEARQRAAAMFGVSCSDLLTGANVVQLAEAVREKVEAAAEEATALPQHLLAAAAYLGMAAEELTKSPRYRTAQAVAALVKALAKREPTPRLQALAKATLNTSAAAMGRSLTSAGAVGKALGQVFWEPLQAIGHLADERGEQGQAIVARLVEALQADELTTALAPALQEAQQQAVRLLAPVPPPGLLQPVLPRPGPRPGQHGGTSAPVLVPGWKAVEAGERDNLAAEDLERLVAELRQKLAAGKGRRLKLTWTVLEEEAR
jgi:hypothetical protein